jgi:hypothetical protein
LLTLLGSGSAAPSSFASSNAANQPADSSVGTSTNPAGASAASSATLSASDVAAAIAASQNSASYSFATVAQNALITLNAGIAQLGHQPDDYTTGAQWNQIFGGMDRRSLYAVASNQGGQFTTAEQQTASDMMITQLGNVLGNVGSDGSEAGQMQSFGNYIAFLNNVSPEEKQSVTWAVEMASAMTSYNDFASDLGQPKQTDDGTNPLVKMLMAAMNAAQYDPSKDKTVGQTTTLSEVLAEPWAQGFQSQIQQAYAASLPQGSSVNVQA